MCGRYSLAPAEFSEIQLEFQVAGEALSWAPRYNIAPSSGPGYEPPIVSLDGLGQRQLTLARWWLIPSSWRRALRLLPTAFNARAEELGAKRFWSQSFDARRCLVPTTGWREFTGPTGHREPRHFHYQHHLFAFAGIWDEWLSPEGDAVRSFAIVTVPADDVVRPVHDRMPLRVDPASYATWLDPGVAGVEALASVRSAVAPPLFEYATDPAGNDVRCEGPDVIAPARRRQLDLFGS
ncbi:MAG TPA: SOS response-associated peptidase [Polyangiaceae bacterium]|nr:SOS response-associated peptidase [Polyangiaceae bacterium]